MLAQFETLNALLQTRYSCRAFLDRPVAHSDIEKIVEAAQRSRLGVTRSRGSLFFAKARKPRCWPLP